MAETMTPGVDQTALSATAAGDGNSLPAASDGLMSTPSVASPGENDETVPVDMAVTFADNWTKKLSVPSGGTVSEGHPSIGEIIAPLKNLPEDQVRRAVDRIYTNFGIDPVLVAQAVAEFVNADMAEYRDMAIPTNNPGITLMIERSNDPTSPAVRFRHTPLENILRLNQEISDYHAQTGRNLFPPTKILGMPE